MKKIIIAFLFAFALSQPVYAEQKVKTASANLKTNTIYINKITSKTFLKTENYIRKMVKNGATNITYKFHSPGGSVAAMKMMIIQMKIYKQKGITFHTRVEKGKLCASACTAIFATGDSRKLHKDSKWMFHSPKPVLSKDKLQYLSSPEAPDAVKVYLVLELKKKQKYFTNTFERVCKSDALSNTITNMKDNFFKAKELLEKCPRFGQLTKTKLTPRESVVFK